MHRVLTAAVCAVAIGSAAPAAAQRELVIAAQTPPSALDPHYHNTTNNSMVLRQIFEPLFELDTQARQQPRLATSLRMIDPLTWELKLREGVRFHDGTPFEADDIAYTFARVPTVPNSPALFTPQVRTISAIEIKDPQTVILRTREPNPLLPYDLTGPPILSRRVHGPNPSTSDFTSGKLAIGTGPYRYASYLHNERLEVTRNTDYWGPAEPWDKVTFRYIPQGGSRMAALLAGEVDLIDYVPLHDVPRLERDPRFALFAGDSVTFVYLAPDAMRETTPFALDRQGKPLDRNPLADRRVREALSLAIPREVIAERLYHGQARAADQFAAPIAEHRLPNLPPLPHDPVRARALLAEAGYPQGFRITIHGPNGFFPGDDSLLQALAQAFTRVGVETQVQTLPPATLFSKATNREFSLFMTYFSSYLTINPMRQVVMTRNPDLGHGPFNRQRYSNPEMDVPLAEAMTTMDPERREALTHQAARALLEDKGVLPIIFLRNIWAGKRDKVVYEPSPVNHTAAQYAKPVQ